MIEGALKKLEAEVDEAEVFSLDSRMAVIKTKKSEIESFVENSSLGYGLRVIKNRKMGFYFTNALDEEALKMVVKIAEAAQPDEYLSLPPKQQSVKTSRSIFQLDVEEGLALAEELVRGAAETPEAKPTTGTVSWSTSNIVLANSKGVSAEKAESLISAYMGTVAKNPDPATGFHYEVSTKKDIDTFEVGKAAAQLARASLNGKRLETGKREVVLRPMAVTELFENALLPSFSADNVQRGRSRLHGKLGQKVFGNIRLVDDSTLEDGLMTEDFDDEGVPAQRTILVEGGELRDFLYDSYTANKEGKDSTGNGSRRSYSDMPAVSPSNFIVTGGEGLDDETGCLVVHGLIGAHTSNPISGDFSCEVRNAFIDGKPIQKAIVSGNVFDLLNQEISLGRDYKQYSSIVSPSIKLSDVTVVG